MRAVGIFLSLIYFAGTGYGQGAPTLFGTPTGSAPAAAPTAPMGKGLAEAPVSTATPPPTGTAGDYSSGTVERSADKIFDVNKDSVDFENGTMKWKGQTFNLGNSRAVRARLERYLAAPKPTNDAIEHARMLDQIEELLSPKTLTRQNYQLNFQKAWELLFKAAEFDSDDKNCLTIATQVEKARRDKLEAQGLRTTHAQQEKIRKYQSEGIISRARMLETKRDEAAQRSNPSKEPKTSRDPQTGTEELQSHRADLARMDANIKKTEVEIAAMELKSKLEFQSQIVALLFQRRFKHTIIATAFYRYTFNSSDHQLKVGAKQIKEMLPVSDFSPTIDSVDMLAREAMKDVDIGMRTVGQLYERGGRYKALERLQETFFLGEHDAQVMFFDPEKKLTLIEIWQGQQDLQRMGDERDLSGVEDLVRKLKVVASDFPSAQITSRVNNAKRASNLAVFAAKQAAFAGDAEKVEAQLERAAKIWPMNPAIEDFTKQVESRSDVVSQKLPEFDRLHGEKRFREIFNQKEVFAVALVHDKTRSELLKEILEKVGKIDGLILNARVQNGQGNGYVAWDMLEEATKIDSGDIELGRARSELAPQVSDYTRSLANAGKNEAGGNFSASLTWYLSAQDINPVSELCRQGIMRVGPQMLSEAKEAKRVAGKGD